MTIPSAPFTCLAIETATDLPSLALLRGESLTVRESRGLRAPSRGVFEWVRELLEESSVSLGELDCIAFGAGPGSFTGVRVAVALAQGLGYARGLPLCPVSTLAALAAGAFRRTTADAVACCLDAHMGEVYVGVYRRDAEEGVRALAPDVLAAPDAVSLPGDRAYFAAGPGWAAYPQLAGRLRGRFTGMRARSAAVGRRRGAAGTVALPGGQDRAACRGAAQLPAPPGGLRRKDRAGRKE